MIKKHVHITFLLACISFVNVLWAQKTHDLNSDFLMDGARYGVQVKILNNEPSVSFSGSTIMIQAEGVEDNILRLKFILKERTNNINKKINFQLETSSTKIVPKPQKGVMGNIGKQINFEIGDLTSQLSANIQLLILLSDGTVLKTYSIPVIHRVKEAHNNCAGITGLPEQLACLKGLSNPTPSEVDLRKALNNQQNEANKQLQSFYTSNSNNSTSIQCQNCDIAEFTLKQSPNSSFNTRGNSWIIGKTTLDIRATIQHNKWTDLSRTFVVPALKNVPEKDVGKISEEEIIPEDRLKDEKVPQGQMESLTSTPDTEPVSTPEDLSVSTSIDTFWRDSIVNFLTLSNVINRNDSLLNRLEQYTQRTDARADKKLLAYILPYALPFVLILFLLFLLLVFGRQKSKPTQANAEDSQVEITNKQESVASKPTVMPEKKHPAPQPDEPANDNSDNLINFDEVSTPAAVAAPPLDLIVSHPDFIIVDLLPCWRDTVVERLFFHKNCIRDLSQKVEQENAFQQNVTDVEELSEIGGFLLGHIYPQGSERYDLAVSTFVPITPDSNDRFAVKFGDKAWSQLDDAYQLYPGQRLLGWFHTHPGHGLFLSQADLVLHEGAFKQPYHFALEVDPTTPGIDIAFFTRQPNGPMNNKKDRRIAQWWSLNTLKGNIKNQ